MKINSIVCAAALVAISCSNDPAPSPNIVKNKDGKMDTTFKPLPWVHTTNIYEVNLRQYTAEGSINAFRKEMPRLKEMGVEVIWFMPVTPLSMEKGKGSMGSPYACASYTGINPQLGTLDDFKALVKEAHGMGLKVIIDWVANHTGWGHEWTKSHPEYYEKTKEGGFKIAEGMDDIIELDFNNPAMIAAMIEAMKFWVKECDIDGFRCDLAAWVPVGFWKQARLSVDAVKPLFWLAECDQPDFHPTFDASYTWEWMHKTEDFYKKNLPLSSLDSILHKYDKDYPPNSMKAWFTTNHDENSWNGTEYEKYGDMAKALAVFSCTWNGVPLMYSGQEMPNNKRLKFFDKDPIEWNGKYELAGFYKTLFALHKNNPALRGGDPAVTTYRLQTSQNAHVLAYLRKNDKHEVLVVLNMSKENLSVDITDTNLSGTFKNVFSGAAADFSSQKKLEMKAWEYLVFEK
jgi:alpha-amylase